jgi:hypothetical protein
VMPGQRVGNDGTGGMITRFGEQPRINVPPLPTETYD